MHLPPQPDASALQLNMIPQPLVVIIEGGSATLDVTVSSLTSDNTGPATITIAPLPSGLSTSPVTWSGQSKVTFTIAATADAPVSEFHASVAATIGNVSAGSATTTIEVSSADGALDPTFGTNGIMTVPFTTSADALAFTSGGNGSWIVGGELDSAHGLLARVHADGTLDSTFAPDAAFDPVLSLDVSSSGNVLALTTSNTLVLDPSGHVMTNQLPRESFGAWDGSGGFLVGSDAFFHFDGSFQVTTSSSVSSATALASFQGSAFVGVSGAPPTVQKWSVTSPGLYAPIQTFSAIVANGVGRIAVDANARLLASSSATTLSLMRFLADSTIDTTFGNAGTVSVDSGETATIIPVVIFPLQSGKIVVVASITTQTNQGIMLARLLADGSPDTAFGAYGRTKTELAHPLDIIGAGYDASTKRVCTASDVATTISTIEMACYHVEP